MKPGSTHEAALREALLKGSTLTDAARAAGVSKTTAFRYFHMHRAELLGLMLLGSPLSRLLGRPMCRLKAAG